MTSHELARLLLTLPDLPVATHAHNHTYMSAGESYAAVNLARLGSYAGDHMLIGDFNPHRWDLNPPNWSITQVFHDGFSKKRG